MLTHNRPAPSPSGVPAVGVRQREWDLDPAVQALVRAVPRVTVAGLPVATLGVGATAALMIAAAGARGAPARPLYLTSVDGDLLSRCARDPSLDRLFRIADAVSADGWSTALASRLPGRLVPERVATIDLFHCVCRRAEAAGASLYLYGAGEAENRRAVAAAQARYPRLRIVGHSPGQLAGRPPEAVLSEIDGLAPDLLWVDLAAPRAQAFAVAYARHLRNVGVIRTADGLFARLAGRGAPAWLRRIGAERVRPAAERRLAP